MMKPMELKEKTACCGVLTLQWVKEKQRYVCQCGKFEVSDTGRVIGDKTYKFGRRGGRPRKEQQQNPFRDSL